MLTSTGRFMYVGPFDTPLLWHCESVYIIEFHLHRNIFQGSILTVHVRHGSMKRSSGSMKRPAGSSVGPHSTSSGRKTRKLQKEHSVESCDYPAAFGRPKDGDATYLKCKECGEIYSTNQQSGGLECANCKHDKFSTHYDGPHADHPDSDTSVWLSLSLLQIQKCTYMRALDVDLWGVFTSLLHATCIVSFDLKLSTIVRTHSMYGSPHHSNRSQLANLSNNWFV